MSARTLARAAAALVLALSAAAHPQTRGARPARGIRYERRVMRVGTSRATVHAVYVDLCDPAVELRATAPDEGGRTVAQWAGAVGAVVAVNGDYFDMVRLAPLGLARGDGRTWPAARREHRDAVFVAAPGGRVSIVDAPEGTHEALWDDPSAVPPTWTEAVAVRERVLVRGVVRESPAIVHDGARHPRTALGLTADGHTLLLVVVDGRSESDGGATSRELGELLRALGAWEGMKLDGGGSSQMYVAGRVVNHPSDGAPRAVATHLGVRVRGGVPALPSRCR